MTLQKSMGQMDNTNAPLVFNKIINHNLLLHNNKNYYV